MARQLEFDRAEVVARAADAFWGAGYEALSAFDIAHAMGVAKSSLYNTFGSKRDLFIESLDHYSDSQRAMVSAGVKRQNVVTQLRKMLREVVADNNACRGCLLVNTATEFGGRDGEVQQHVKAGFDGMIEAFTALIQAGKEAGHIRSTVNSKQYAVSLVTGIAGLRVLVKGGFSNAELNAVIENLLSGLAA